MSYRLLRTHVASGCLLLAVCSLLLVGCSDEVDDELVESSEVRGQSRGSSEIVEFFTPVVEGRQVTFTAKILSMGASGIKKQGFAYSNKNPLPEPKAGVNSLYRAASLQKDSTFTVTIKNLAEDTPYYVRAYAITNDADTVYSEIYSFEAEVVNPVVTTMPVVNRSKRAAVVFAKFVKAGTKNLTSWGVCLSHHPLPTIDDMMETAKDTCKAKGYEGEFGIFFQTLEPATMYHARAFATTSDGKVFYGEDKLFRTSEGGRCTWHWASNESGAKSAGAYDRITEAMDSAMFYYNNYSNLNISASVEYNSGVQTADCSLGGWIRFGSNSRYQWVGTAQHELNHGLGGGLAGNWGNLLKNGVWSGPIAQRTVRAVMLDQTQELHGDSQHFWPCGINQREECTNGTKNNYGENIANEKMLRANAMVFNGMRLDGLWNHY